MGTPSEKDFVMTDQETATLAYEKEKQERRQQEVAKAFNKPAQPDPLLFGREDTHRRSIGVEIYKEDGRLLIDVGDVLAVAVKDGALICAYNDSTNHYKRLETNLKYFITTRAVPK